MVREMKKFIRTCQECFFKQEDKEPLQTQSAAYERFLNRKCKRCKSESLDYGSYKDVDK